MRLEGGGWFGRRGFEPDAEIFHQAGNLHGIGKDHRRTRDPSRVAAIDAREFRLAASDDPPVQLADDIFIDRRGSDGYFAHPQQGLIMINRFEVVAQRFAADGNAMFDHFRRLTQREGISLDRIGRESQIDIVMFLQLRHCGAR